MTSKKKEPTTHHTPPQTQKPLNLALQGGGSHGAFGWGVLDKLAEDGRVHIEGMSGTSAGAVNAVLFGYGLMKGGADGARKALEDFWWDVAQTGMFASPVHSDPWQEYTGTNFIQQMSFNWFDAMTRTFSPYQFNPTNYNPLQEILARHIDFSDIKKCSHTNIFICATNVRTGSPKVFHNHEITMDALLASTCLPFVFQAVEVDGEHYWDGGYTGNPALYPLIYHTQCRDFLLVHINPVVREEIPRSSADIINRLNEVTFNSSLLQELRAIAFVQKLIHQDWLKDEYKDHLKDIRMHAIRADKDMRALSISSKFNADWDFLTMLRDMGRKHAETWLKQNFDDIGKRSTIDIHKAYL